jgi:hypothetical protein
LAVARVKPGRGRVWSARGARAVLGLLSIYGESAVDGLGAHTDVCDLVMMTGSVGVVRAAVLGEGPAAKLAAA